ncbi:MAG: MFS transporter [bacterium]|nr:MFS transporter [bacterium]
MRILTKTGVIFSIVFVDFLGLSFILPLYPELASRFGLSATLITLLSASYALMQFIFSPILGRLSDRIGRKPVLVVTSLGTAVSFLLFGWANSVWLIFASRILNGIFGSSVAVAQAYIADVTGRHERTEGMGTIGAALGLGLIFGPAMSGFLGHFGFGAPAYGAAILTFLNSIFVIFFLKESLAKNLRVKKKILNLEIHIKNIAEVLKHPLMGRIMLTYFLAMFALASVQNIATLFAEERFHLTIAEIGIVFALIGLVLLLAQGFLVGRLVKYTGESVIVVLGIFLSMLGYFMTPTIEYIWLVLIAAGFMALGVGLCIPALNSLISKNASGKEQGEIFGAAQSLIGFALIFAPIFGGGLYDLFGSGSPFFAAGFITLIALYFALVVFGKLKKV